MKWMVTGATGLVGRAVVERLVAEGHSVLALSRSAERFFAGVDRPNFAARNFDLCTDSPQQLGQADDELGLVMLAANITTSTDLRELPALLALDVYGHLRLAEWCRTSLRYGVYASSCTVYGWPETLPVAETAPAAPQTPYAICKLAAEAALGELFRAWGVPLSVLRIGQVYGPGAPRIGAIYGFLQAAAEGRVPHISCNPDAFRDYAHVDDIADGILRAMHERSAGVFNLGSDQPVSVAELARAALDVAGRAGAPAAEPQSTTWNMLMDSSRARSTFGYAPRCSIRDGLSLEYRRLFGQGSSASRGE